LDSELCNSQSANDAINFSKDNLSELGVQGQPMIEKRISQSF